MHCGRGRLAVVRVDGPFHIGRVLQVAVRGVRIAVMRPRGTRGRTGLGHEAVGLIEEVLLQHRAHPADRSTCGGVYVIDRKLSAVKKIEPAALSVFRCWKAAIFTPTFLF